jgi:hypothetical protein
LFVLRLSLVYHYRHHLGHNTPMSDSSFSPPPAASTSTGTKRKSTGGTSAPKRAKKSQPDPYANAKSLINAALESPESFSLPTGEAEYRKLIITIAEYAKSLEGSMVVARSTGKAAPPPKTPEQIAVEAERLSGMISRGISKQMAVSRHAAFSRC